MSFNINKGVLSIQDPKGKYMGMQNVARNFLINQNIGISTQGPKEAPDSVVIEITKSSDKPIPEEKQHTMRMKADYLKNATPEFFANMLSKATTIFTSDDRRNRGDTYNIYYNNGICDDLTKEQFYNEKPNYTFVKTV